MRKYIISFCILVSVSQPLVANTKQQLMRTLDEIHKKQQQFDNTQQSKNTALQAIQSIEKKIATAQKQVKQLRMQGKKQIFRATEIQDLLFQSKQKIALHIDQILDITLLMYIQQQKSPLRLLFNSDDTQDWQRNLEYLKYFQKYQLQQLTKFNNLSAQNRALSNEQVKAKKLSTLQQTNLKRSLLTLNQQLKERKSLLATLSNRQLETSKQLKQLHAFVNKFDSASVQKLTRKANPSLHKFRGKIPWPMNNKAIISTDMHGKGIYIYSKLQQPVVAVADATVLYADWVKNLGLMVVLDHGSGFLSVYAHNGTVNVAAGDTVKVGKKIATVGDTGGKAKPVLYFELYKKNQNITLRKWMKPIT